MPFFSLVTRILSLVKASTKSNILEKIVIYLLHKRNEPRAKQFRAEAAKHITTQRKVAYNKYQFG